MAEHDNPENYSEPNLPPPTPPAIDGAADPAEAAAAPVDGDDDVAGSHKASVDRGDEDTDIPAGDTPDEVKPDRGDTIEPDSPAEVETDPGDMDNPGQTPAEAPPEILTPPD